MGYFSDAQWLYWLTGHDADLEAIGAALIDKGVGAVTMREPRVDYKRQCRWLRLYISVWRKRNDPLMTSGFPIHLSPGFRPVRHFEAAQPKAAGGSHHDSE